MPWKIVMHHESCPANKPVAVVKEDDGKVVGCHANSDGAKAQLAALNANVED
jgi:hypothetical protein